MKPAVVFAMLLLMLLAAACSDGASTTGTTGTPDDTQQFDPNLLSTVVLQPADVPPDYPSFEQTFNPAGATATSFASFLRGSGVTISSSIVQYADAKSRADHLDPLRRRFEKLIGAESTIRLSGADTAFVYQGAGPPAEASLIVRGRYVASVVIQTTNEAPIASDRAVLERYTGLLLSRLQTLLADPSVITPVAGAPTYAVPSTATP